MLKYYYITNKYIMKNKKKPTLIYYSTLVSIPLFYAFSFILGVTLSQMFHLFLLFLSSILSILNKILKKLELTEEEEEIIKLINKNELKSMSFNGYRFTIDTKEARIDSFNKNKNIFNNEKKK